MKQLIYRSLIPLTVGSIIYLFFRNSNLIMFEWIKVIHLYEPISKIRDLVSFSLPNWVLYSLPNSLWVYSFCYTLKHFSNKRNYLMYTPIIFAILIEFGQLSAIIPGTFDLIDLFLILIIALTILYTEKYYSTPTIKEIKQKVRTAGIITSIAFFLFIGAGSNGAGDAVQDLYIEEEEDPIRQQEMRDEEDSYHMNNRTDPEEE